jgi:hypothetical protein
MLTLVGKPDYEIESITENGPMERYQMKYLIEKHPRVWPLFKSKLCVPFIIDFAGGIEVM